MRRDAIQSNTTAETDNRLLRPVSRPENRKRHGEVPVPLLRSPYPGHAEEPELAVPPILTAHICELCQLRLLYERIIIPRNRTLQHLGLQRHVEQGGAE